MEVDYELIDNEERHQYEFHVVAGYIHKHPEWKKIVMKGIHIQ